MGLRCQGLGGRAELAAPQIAADLVDSRAIRCDICTCVNVSVMADDRCDVLALDAERAEQLRRTALAPAAAASFAERAAALGDPTRARIVAVLLEGGDLCVCDLAWVAERAQSLVSHHLRVLRSAGLAASRRDGKMVFYSLTETGKRLTEAILDDVAAETA